MVFTMNEQTASRSLTKAKLRGTVSVGDLSYADFSVPRVADFIEGIFIEADRNRVNLVELYIGPDHLATYRLPFDRSNEIKFFRGSTNLELYKLPFVNVIFRVICHGKGVEHSRIWILYNNNSGNRNEEEYNKGSFTIPKEISTTGNDLICHYKGGMIENLYKPPSERIFHPIYSYSSKNGQHQYCFIIPGGQHNLTQMKIRGCENHGNSCFQIQLRANDMIIEEWVSYTPSTNINSFFTDKDGVNHPLCVWRCPYNELEIVLVSKTKLKRPNIEFTLKRVEYDDCRDGKNLPKMKYICLKSEKVIVYSNGTIAFDPEGQKAD